MSKLSILAEFWEFIKYRKRYWLTPIVVVLLLFGLLMVISGGSAVAPFLYPIF